MSSTAIVGSRPPGFPRWERQRSFDELGRRLQDVTFCVVDLETTGGSARDGSMITEVGAVKVRGGEILGEFQSLVTPRQASPPFIAVLTGITDSMVASAPSIEQVLPQVLAFAEGTVLVRWASPDQSDDEVTYDASTGVWTATIPANTQFSSELGDA